MEIEDFRMAAAGEDSQLPTKAKMLKHHCLVKNKTSEIEKQIKQNVRNRKENWDLEKEFIGTVAGLW